MYLVYRVYRCQIGYVHVSTQMDSFIDYWLQNDSYDGKIRLRPQSRHNVNRLPAWLLERIPYHTYRIRSLGTQKKSAYKRLGQKSSQLELQLGPQAVADDLKWEHELRVPQRKRSLITLRRLSIFSLPRELRNMVIE